MRAAEPRCPARGRAAHRRVVAPCLVTPAVSRRAGAVAAGRVMTLVPDGHGRGMTQIRIVVDGPATSPSVPGRAVAPPQAVMAGRGMTPRRAAADGPGMTRPRAVADGPGMTRRRVVL